MISLRISSKSSLRPFRENWWGPTKNEWAPVLMQENKVFWQKQADPSTGRPWAPLDPEYRSWKVEHYGSLPILQTPANSMEEQTEIKVRGNIFTVKTTKAGVFHQYGTEKMAARPWMGVPNRSLNRLAEIAWKNILR